MGEEARRGRWELGALDALVEQELQAWDEGAIGRLWNCDHTLWQDDPVEVADRLGWLASPREMLDRVGELESFAAGLDGAGFTHAVVMGMGGSSLFPEVAAETFGDGGAGLRLSVLDTTDPGAIRRVERDLPLETTVFVAASKSGTTIETRCHLDYFWDRVKRPGQFVAITDPGSPLGGLARDRSFRAVFENRPDIGGRYSALSHFGLVPAALGGVEIEELLDRALAMADESRRPGNENPAVRLGVALGVAARSGRDKLTLRLAPDIAAFGAWLEQLIAESTGKMGSGIVPIDGEAPRPAADYGPDRMFVALGGSVDESGWSEARHPFIELPYDDPYDLGAEVFRWEVATAVAGRVLGINPFDQPDVAAAKEATSRVLSEGLPEIETVVPATLVDQLRPGDYLGIQAYLDPGSPEVGRLRHAADVLGARHGVAVTVGLGPRYLHSTGQLHKGGPPTGVFVQVVGEDAEDVAIPGRSFGFSTLKRAQAAGDLLTLQARGLRAGRVELGALLDDAG